MKESTILSLLLLLSLSGWAKASNVSANDSVCIIEGTIKNIPDGCDVILYGSAGKYSGKQKTVAQIKKGKFRFEKMMKGDEKYSLFLYPCIDSLTIYVSPGTKTTITGNGTHPSTWLVKNDNPLQKEWNAYQQVEMNDIAGYQGIQNRLYDIEEKLYSKKEREKKSLLKEREELIEKQKDLSKNYVEVLYDFMKDRQYSEIFESKLKPMLEKAEYVDKKEDDWDATCSNKVMELRKKIPQTADTLKAEEPVVLKRKAISTSERDGGWCTFYDAEKSYEVDAHTEVYTVCVAKTNGTIEMSDKSNRIIPAGCPVILHLNTQLEDGTYRAELKETNKLKQDLYFTKMNLLEMSVSSESIKAWRIGFSTDENKAAFYPWETEKAEAGVIYLKMPNSYIKGYNLEVKKTNTVWDIDDKKNLGYTQWNTRNLGKRTFVSGSGINYCENATMPKVDIQYVVLKGQPIKMAEGNESMHPRFLINNVLFFENAFGAPSMYIGKFGMDGWDAHKMLFRKRSDYIWLEYAKGKNNSLIIKDSHFRTSRSVTIIPDASSIESISDSTKWQKYDISKLENFISEGMKFYPLSDSTYLTLGSKEIETAKMEPQSIMSIVNFKKQTYTPLKWDYEDGIEADELTKFRVYTESSYLYGNGKGHYLFRRPDGRFAFIFTIEGDRIHIVKFLYDEYPIYHQSDDIMMPPTIDWNPKKINIETTNDHVYTLLLDRNIYGKVLKPGDNLLAKPNDIAARAQNGDIVEIYDWNGRLHKKVIKLDHIGRRIMLSDDAKTLYLLNDDYYREEIPQIWAYDISDIDSKTGIKDLEDIATMELAYNTSKDAVEEEQGEKDTNVVHEGEMMVDFELYDYDDKPHHLNEFVGSGKYTILEFSGLSCGPCHMAKPVLEELYKENKDRFEMITISTDMEKVWKKKPLGEVSWHEWNDHNSAMEIAQKYVVMGIPTFFIISPDGKVENKSVGLREFFEALKNYIPAEKLEKYMKKRKEN